MLNVIKPLIPRNVADAIEWLRADGANNEAIVDCAVGRATHPSAREVRSYARGNFDTLLAALVNGYTVEKTAEEIAEEERQAAYAEIAERYRGKRRDLIYFLTSMPCTSATARGFADGIRYTLNTLGIEISGVNAPEGVSA